jgi:phosphohistidine swiveling domain-containing protein
MEGVERNRMLSSMASLARGAPYPDRDLRRHLSDDSGFQGLLRRFRKRFGGLSCGTKQCVQGPDAIADLVIELASAPEDTGLYRTKDPSALKQSFLDRFEGQERGHEEELLELARASCRTRDNDNIYMDRIKGQKIMAIDEYRRRFSKDGRITDPDVRRAVDGMRAPDTVWPKSPEKKMKEKGFSAQSRQITGQPAGPGIARGKARVIADASDLRLFKAGEVLVCDAIDPSITFVVPLASAIVERRGGMLIHGAIIAKEYGLACVTGIPDATSLIQTGDTVTVDG